MLLQAFADPNLHLLDDEVDPRLFPNAPVLGYAGEQGAVAYPFEVLAEQVVINDEIDGEPAVIFWQLGAAGMYDAQLADGMMLTFTAKNGQIRDLQTGSIWNSFGRAVAGELAGIQLHERYADSYFWFEWAAFQPDTLIWEPGITTDEAWLLNR